MVGKIEIVPPIKAEEQSYKALDPFNVLVNYWWNGSAEGTQPGEICDPPSRRTQ